MFGLTFWENWYILAETPPVSAPVPQPLTAQEPPLLASLAQLTTLPQLVFAAPTSLPAQPQLPEMKLVFYTGHTLQGSYQGAFVYSRRADVTPATIEAATRLITSAGLQPEKFCMIRNQCFAAGTATFEHTKSSPRSTGVRGEPGTTVAAGGQERHAQRFWRSPPHYVGYDTPFWLIGQK
jgi:hypothetical protein